MKIVAGYLVALAWLASWSGFVIADTEQWRLVKDSGRLRVERRAWHGSGLDELRGVTVVRASLNAVVALLRDADYNAQWVYRSGGARILAEEGSNRAYVYGIVDAPPPLRDRDSVVRFDYQQDPRSRVIMITITNVPAYVAQERGFVRVPDFGGFWKLQPRRGGRVEVTYQVRGDPGGWVPLWLANYAAQVSVIRTLQNMPTALERYAGAYSDGVLELPED